MPKVKFIGKGTQYHPTLGQLVEGKVYDLPNGTYPESLFKPADGRGVSVRDALDGLNLNQVRAVRDALVQIDPGFGRARDTSTEELIGEIEKIAERSAKRQQALKFMFSKEARKLIEANAPKKGKGD